MYKGKDVIGKAIVSIESGEVLDTVRDVFFDARSQRVHGFLTDEGGLMSSAEMLPFESVHTIGPDGILVASANVIVKAKDVEHGIETLDEDNVAVGTKIMTEEGKDLGNINDVFFDEHGVIEGYEVTGGIFADALSGKSFIPSLASFVVGKDVAIVPAEVATIIENQAGGLAAMTAKTQESMEAAGSSVQANSGDVTDKIKQAWEKAKGVAAEVTGKTEQKIEESRINAALGRPVTRVIFTRTDEPILNTGDLITNEAIARAREHGVLDQLLSSVYKDSPEFSSDELKAKRPEEKAL